MKQCSKCKSTKSFSHFHKSSCNLDGLRGFCKECLNSQNRAWKNRNRKKNSEISRNHYLKNRDKRLSQTAKWWRENPHVHAAKQARRRFKLKNASPAWLTKVQLAHIRAYYETAKIIRRDIGANVDVDHIVPLMGKNVCGLHVPWNLQLLEHSANCQKRNSYEI